MRSQLSNFWPFSTLLGFLGFWAILGLDYTGYWFWDFLGQNFKICRNSVFWLSTPPNIKFIIVESRLEGYVVTNIIFWPFIALLGFLGFWAILGLDYIGFWFWEFFGQNFKICRNLALWLPTPTNLKFFIVESCLEGYAFTNINFLAIFRNFEYFGLLGYFGPRLYRLLILRFFWVKISKSVKIQYFDCLPPLT